jgi:hypothetical protein
MPPIDVKDLPPDQWYNPPPEELGEVDLAGLRANLRLTPDERLQKLVQHNEFVRELIRSRELYLSKRSKAP